MDTAGCVGVEYEERSGLYRYSFGTEGCLATGRGQRKRSSPVM